MKSRNFLTLIFALLIITTIAAHPAFAKSLRTSGLVMDTDGSKLFVSAVIKDSPADKAGVKPGDIILGFKLGENSKEKIVGDVKISNSFNAIQRCGRVITIKVKRGSEEKEFTFTPEDMNLTPANMPSSLPAGKVTEIKKSVLHFSVDKPDKVSTEDEFLIFQGDEMICRTKIRKKNGKFHTYGLSIPRPKIAEMGDAKLVFYSHISSYFIKKTLKK